MLLINKPKGWTSFDVVAYARKRALTQPSPTGRGQALPLPTGEDRGEGRRHIKVGHAGTLDPFATGLLIVAVGREETKKLDEFKNLPKMYVATIHLGATSDTMDSTGTIEQLSNRTINQENKKTRKQCETILNSFVGKQLQTPPMFSAKQINGVRLYKLARQGKTVERQPNEIEIYKIKLLEYNYPILKIEVECSAGTYIRTLANDIGEKLGVGAYCEELERTAIGPYKLKNAQNLTSLDFKKISR